MSTEIERAAQQLTEALCVYRTTKRGEHLAQLRQAVWNMEDAVDGAFDALNIQRDLELAKFKRMAFGL